MGNGADEYRCKEEAKRGTEVDGGGESGREGEPFEQVDGHRVEVVEQVQDPSGIEEPRLWFVNLGAYDPTSMAEQHHFGVVVARSSASAKARARQRWLKGKEQVHKDDLHHVAMDSALDDLLPIQGNGQWHLRLTADQQLEEATTHPDWYGYWTI